MKTLPLLLLVVLFSVSISFAQTDSTKTANAASTAPPKEKSNGKARQNYILYVGGNLNSLSVNSDAYQSNTEAGYHFGFSYRAKNFFYWQVGVRYNVATYNITPTGVNPDSTDGKYTVSALEIPLTVGINLLKATDRVVNLRFFASAYPSFTMSVDENLRGVTKDSLNSTLLYGQAGVGVDVMFLVIELGYNFGFGDLEKNNKSMPGQAFLSLGFRF